MSMELTINKGIKLFTITVKRVHSTEMIESFVNKKIPEKLEQIIFLTNDINQITERNSIAERLTSRVLKDNLRLSSIKNKNII